MGESREKPKSKVLLEQGVDGRDDDVLASRQITLVSISHQAVRGFMGKLPTAWHAERVGVIS